VYRKLLKVTGAAETSAGHVATSPQVGLHCFGEGVGHREAAQAGTVLTEGADEML
jgi:hypothetical protein